MSAQIVRGMPMADYLADPGIDNTYLGRMLQSPMHAKMASKEQTPAMALGSLTHTLILEPDQASASYYPMPECDGRTKEGKAIKEKAAAECGGREIVGEKAWNKARAMYAAVLNHPAAFQLLAHAKDRELSIFWTDETTGLRCKARLDAISSMGGLWLADDLKTTCDASPAVFAKSIANYGYHRQGSFYLEAGQRAGFDVGAFVIIAVESDEPFGVAVYRIDDATLDEGRSEWKRLLAMEAECRKCQRWPAYSDEVQTIGLPAWAFKDRPTFTGEIKF